MPKEKPWTKGDPRAAKAAARAREAGRKRRATERQLEELAVADPKKVFEELAAQLAAGVLLAIRRWRQNTEGEAPTRTMMDASRELRQTLDRVIAYREQHEQTHAAAEFLAEVEARAEAFAGLLDEGVAPAVEVVA